MVWNEETIRHLRDLWAHGLSTAEIGRRLGVSKNAIVGKAHRLDLAGRPSPIRRDKTKPAHERADLQQRPRATTLPLLQSEAAPAAPATAGHALRVVQPLSQPAAPAPRPPSIVLSPVGAALPPAPLQARRNAPVCCWPIGEPGTKSFCFCDEVSAPGKPYCDAHAKLAYVRIKDRKEDAA